MPISSQSMWPSPAKVIISRCLPACRGYLPHVDFRIDEFVVGYLDQKLLDTACKLGAPVQILEFIMARTIPNWKEVVKSATEGGHLHVFEWMVGRQDGRGPWLADRQWCLTNAATYGHFELVKWLHSRGESTFFYNMAFRQAARNGHLQVVQWMHEHTDVDSEEGAMDDAAENGHLEVVQWLYKKIKDCGVLSLTGAAGNGHLRTLEWLHQRVSCSEVCTSRIMDKAVDGGHFHVVEWVFEHCSKGCSKSAAWGATRNGDFNMLMWLNTRFHDQMNSDAIHKAASGGNLDFVKWFHDNPSPGSYRLGKLADQCADPASIAQREVSNALEQFHAGGYYSLVCIMLDRALQGGYLVIAARQFILRRNEEEKRRYVVIAGEKRHIVLLRWLIERGTALDVSTALMLGLRSKCVRYVEAAWWLSEPDRVTLVVTALGKKQLYKLLVWVLENTDFKEEYSRDTIRSAIRNAPRVADHMLFQKLTSPKVRKWCLEVAEEREGRSIQVASAYQS